MASVYLSSERRRTDNRTTDWNCLNIFFSLKKTTGRRSVPCRWALLITGPMHVHRQPLHQLLFHPLQETRRLALHQDPRNGRESWHLPDHDIQRQILHLWRWVWSAVLDVQQPDGGPAAPQGICPWGAANVAQVHVTAPVGLRVADWLLSGVGLSFAFPVVRHKGHWGVAHEVRLTGTEISREKPREIVFIFYLLCRFVLLGTIVVAGLFTYFMMQDKRWDLFLSPLGGWGSLSVTRVCSIIMSRECHGVTSQKMSSDSASFFV